MVKKLLSALLIFSFLFVSGCTGYRESDNSYILSAIGLDKSGENYILYAQVLTAKESEGELKEEVYKAEGATLEDALYSLKGKLYKPISFEHCSIILVTENIRAQNFKNAVEFFRSAKGLNTSVYFAVTEDMEEIISQDAVSEAAGGYDISSLIENQYEDRGIKYKNRLYELLASGDKFIPTFYLPRLSAYEDKLNIAGETVYTDFLPQQQINTYETFILSVLTNRYGKGTVTLDGETAEIQSTHTYFKASVKNDTLFIELKTKFCFKTRSQHFMKKFNQGAEQLLKRKADIFGFSEVLNQKYPKEFSKIQKRYGEAFENSNITFKTEEELF